MLKCMRELVEDGGWMGRHPENSMVVLHQVALLLVVSTGDETEKVVCVGSRGNRHVAQDAADE